MKLLTLNTHSLEERDYEKKLKIFTEEILKEKPDVIALQEVNQPLDGEEADGEVLKKKRLHPLPVRASFLCCPCPAGEPRTSRGSASAPVGLSCFLDVDFSQSRIWKVR